MATETRRLPAAPRWLEWLLPVVLIALLVGISLALTPVTSTGVTITHEVEAAAHTPPIDAATLWV